MTTLLRPTAAAAALALLAACGSSDRLPPAAEPARAPALGESPAGIVVRVGHKPEGLVFDPVTRLLAVGLNDPDRLALVDGRTGRVVRRIALPGSPRHLKLAAPGGPVLVPAEPAGELLEVSLPAGRVRAIPVGRGTHHAAVAGLEARAQPGGVAVSPDGRYVGVVGVRERVLEVFDARTLRPAGKVHVGIGPTHVVGGGGRFFVVDTSGNGLIEIRQHPLRVHRRTHLQGAPYGIALDPVRRRYWVTLTASNRVAELTDHRVLRSFPTVRQPNSVAVDTATGRVFVASRTDGTLQLLDPGPWR